MDGTYDLKLTSFGWIDRDGIEYATEREYFESMEESNSNKEED